MKGIEMTLQENRPEPKPIKYKGWTIKVEGEICTVTKGGERSTTSTGGYSDNYKISVAKAYIDYREKPKGGNGE